MWYNKNLKELYSELGSSRAGLTESQAKERLIKYGKNELLSKKKKSFLRRYERIYNKFKTEIEKK